MCRSRSKSRSRFEGLFRVRHTSLIYLWHTSLIYLWHTSLIYLQTSPLRALSRAAASVARRRPLQHGFLENYGNFQQPAAGLTPGLRAHGPGPLRPWYRAAQRVGPVERETGEPEPARRTGAPSAPAGVVRRAKTEGRRRRLHAPASTRPRVADPPHARVAAAYSHAEQAAPRVAAQQRPGGQEQGTGERLLHQTPPGRVEAKLQRVR